MTDSYKINDQYGTYFLTLQIVDWVDIFTRKIHRDIIIDSLKFCQNEKGLELNAYVIMSNHIHIIAKSISGELSNTIRDFKKFTFKRILEELLIEEGSRKEWILERMRLNAKIRKCNSQYQLWTHNNHAELLYSKKFLLQKLNYIHKNPVKAGIVEKAEHYTYSSAKDYKGKKGLLDIVLIEK
ncbi:MAG: transposase [Bacteroidota bacterium]